MEPGSSDSSPNDTRVSADCAPTLEVVILIGLPGAGKSTFRGQRFVETHAVVSKDVLRNHRRPERQQQRLVTAALASGLSVVVDDTHSSVQERAGIIAMARACGARVVGYFFESPLHECAERNQRRPARKRGPDGGLLAAARRLVAPSKAEGFAELLTVRTLPELRFDVVPFGHSHSQ
jgi:predicted kinase